MSQNNYNKRQDSNNLNTQGGNGVSYIKQGGANQIPKGLSFVFRKSEKLTTALYMVTDIMSEREPMKWKMRETTVEILTGVTQSINATPAEKMTALADVLKKIERMISFLEIAQASRILSEMNASVLKKEYAVLKTSVEYEWSKIFDNDKGMLSENFFNVLEEPKDEDMEQTKEIVRYSPQIENKRHDQKNIETEQSEQADKMSFKKGTSNTLIKRHIPIQVHPERMHGVMLPKDSERNVYHNSSDDILLGHERVDTGKNDRRTIILALIKQKPNLSVKDFVKSIPNVSEKTIQRELLAMVAEGLLIKRGERRWSTYSLA